MATIDRYVDPDATGAGNGTSWGDAYTSLNACEAGQQQNLTDGGGDSMVIHCRSSAGTADSTAVTFAGWTTNSSYFVTVQCDAGDGAKASGWDTARYRLAVASATAILNDIGYTVFDGLQISIDPSAASQRCIHSRYYVTVKNCRLVDLDTDGTYACQGFYIEWGDACLVWNCIVYGFAANEYSYGLRFNSGNANIYNCTVYNNYTGIKRDAGTVVADSCAVFVSVDDFQGTITVTKCASDDNDAESVAESGGGAAWPSDFTAASTGDFTLLSTSNLVGAGTVNTGVFTTDIDGTTRGVAWDIGAYEYVSAEPAGANYVPAIMHLARMRAA